MERLMQKVLLAAHNSPAGCLQEQPVSKPRSSISFSCLNPVHLHQVNGGDPHWLEEQQQRHHLVLHPIRSCCWRSTAYQGRGCSPLTNISSLLPQVTSYFQRRNLRSVTLIPLLSGSSGSFSPRSCTVNCTPEAVGKAEHNAPKGKQSDDQFIWQKYPKLASCLQDWID